MPYFEPLPSDAQWLYWTMPQGELPMISRWPKPNCARVDCRFNLPISAGQVWTAGRWYFQIERDHPSEVWKFRGWLDLQALGVNSLYGDAGVTPNGFRYEMWIVGYDSLPTFGVPGVEVRMRVTETVLGGWTERQFYYFNDGLFPWQLAIRLENFFADAFTASTGGPMPPGLYPKTGGSLSDCFSFPPIDSPEQGFAELNGVDAYIDFLTDMPYSTARFKTEFDIRPQEAGQQIVVTGLKRFGSFATMFVGLDVLQWWNAVTNLSPGLVAGVWQHVRIEYNWSVPGAAYTVWIDDVFQGTSAGGFTISPWDEIGRRGSTIEGKFDLKNFKEWGGAPGAPVLRIDVPLNDDACPVVPVANKGTTFNMDLPSCP